MFLFKPPFQVPKVILLFATLAFTFSLKSSSAFSGTRNFLSLIFWRCIWEHSVTCYSTSNNPIMSHTEYKYSCANQLRLHHPISSRLLRSE